MNTMPLDAGITEVEAQAAPQPPNTKRVYDPKQKEFSVGGPPSFPIADADSVYRLGCWTQGFEDVDAMPNVSF
jgi:hypothetical protein